MTETLYASFASINDAERAMGALLDHGVKPKDISLVAHEMHGARLDTYSASRDLSLNDLKDHAVNGITTTTAHDAESGALTGATIGLGVGVVAALASLFLPGIGLIIGGGALALAISGAAGATGVGAIGGGVYGFLKDQGVSEPQLTAYQETYESGGAVVGIDLDGSLERPNIENVLHKYNATNVGGYSTLMRSPHY